MQNEAHTVVAHTTSSLCAVKLHKSVRMKNMKKQPLPHKTILTPCLLQLSRCVCFGAGPNSKAESNLVDKVGEVVDQIAEEVPSWIDRPSDRHNELHDRVGGLHM